jgi:hypothetical protein
MYAALTSGRPSYGEGRSSTKIATQGKYLAEFSLESEVAL